MSGQKTKPTKESVTEFLNKIEPEEKRRDSLTLLELFKKLTGEKAVMWGPSIVGFGQYHYKSEKSTQEGDWPITGFSPRKQSLTLYVMEGNRNIQELLKRLGKNKTSKACLYIKRLADIDKTVLTEIIKKSVSEMRRLYKNS